jgi:hypothetical protein
MINPGIVYDLSDEDYANLRILSRSKTAVVLVLTSLQFTSIISPTQTLAACKTGSFFDFVPDRERASEEPGFFFRSWVEKPAVRHLLKDAGGTIARSEINKNRQLNRGGGQWES